MADIQGHGKFLAMPLFVTLSELRDFSKKATALAAIDESKHLSGKTVFLSHSTADDEYIPGVVDILENHGGHVYTDDADPELGSLTMLKKAERLRKAVHSCRKLIVFVTPNSRQSQWVTWELALGDGIHNPYNVALFPSANSAFEMEWAENEYLGLYRRIVWGRLDGYERFMWLVYNHHDNTAERLSDWLS